MKFAPGSRWAPARSIAYQRFEAKGLEPFLIYSSAPAKVTNNAPADSYGVGYRLGYIGNLSYVTLGVSYQSRIKMSEFENYSGLLAEQGGFDIPSSWTVGIRRSPIQGVDLAVDVQHINYSEVNSIGNPMLPNLQAARLGDDQGAGFGWKDMTVVKVGMQMHRAAPSLFVRGGYSYGDHPIPTSEMLFNILGSGGRRTAHRGRPHEGGRPGRRAPRGHDPRAVAQRERPESARSGRPPADQAVDEPVGLRSGLLHKVVSGGQQGQRPAAPPHYFPPIGLNLYE